ncbi:hypothetical protein BKA56DRAFT_116741 [Ilyonectria sp. MPI-CAGE-AT-0026]|nr:hypothetical protein BKA56DRAFT_116741 [Ilyonectria sp. MPI-CAGE-AT-0026]
MWEVSWTDPQRESRKEHRDKKAVQRHQNRKKPRADGDSVFSGRNTSFDSRLSRPDFSDTGSIAHSPESTHVLSRGPRSYTTKAPSVMSSDRETDSHSAVSVGSEETTPELSCTPVSTSEGPFPPDHPAESSQTSLGVWERGYALPNSSRWPDHLVPPSPTFTWHFEASHPAVDCVEFKFCQYAQSLTSNSFITKSTEVTAATRAAHPGMKMGSEVTITANRIDESHPRPRSAGALSPSSIFSIKSSEPKSLRRAPSWRTSFTPRKWDHWRPPDTWT